jgi:hypothetical protein
MGGAALLGAGIGGADVGKVGGAVDMIVLESGNDPRPVIRTRRPFLITIVGGGQSGTT